MAAVIGVGGVFYKADDPDALRAWYQRVLGAERRRVLVARAVAVGDQRVVRVARVGGRQVNRLDERAGRLVGLERFDGEGLGFHFFVITPVVENP